MLVTKEQISLLKLYQDVSAKDIADVLVEVERRGKNIVLTPEIAALLSMDSAGRLRPIINTSGKVLSTEDNSSAINTYTTRIYRAFQESLPLFSRADGTVPAAAAGIAWASAIPVAITADGAGAVGAAVEVQPLIALHRQDCVWTVQVSVSGLHQLDFIENTAAAAVTVPDYHTAPPDVFLVAGFPYKFRLMNAIAATNLGVNAGAAGYFPNNSVMTITPMFRDIGV